MVDFPKEMIIERKRNFFLLLVVNRHVVKRREAHYAEGNGNPLSHTSDLPPALLQATKGLFTSRAGAAR